MGPEHICVRRTPTEDGLMPCLPSRQENVLRKPLPLTTTSHPAPSHKKNRSVDRKELLQKNASTGTCVNPAFAITPGNTKRPVSPTHRTKTQKRRRAVDVKSKHLLNQFALGVLTG